MENFTSKELGFETELSEIEYSYSLSHQFSVSNTSGLIMNIVRDFPEVFK